MSTEKSQGFSSSKMIPVFCINIIEWGQDLYGMGPPAHFYFQEKPHETALLSPDEEEAA